MSYYGLPLTIAWQQTLAKILAEGQEVEPRGKLTKELPQHTIMVDMRFPVLMSPARRLQYKFMAAEAYWILSGDDRAETIVPYNSRIAAFSDDGQTFYGAYGPRILSQLEYVVDKLIEDPDSRQAVLITWRPNPQKSKDIPCTVAFDFQIRRGRMNTHVFMRSNDAWLGLPYDAFNFSMLGTLVCAMVNQKRTHVPGVPGLEPGTLFLTAASSHLYREHWEEAAYCAVEPIDATFHPVPQQFATNPTILMNTLHLLRETKPGDENRWWEGHHAAPVT